jgi:outer membrane protein
MKTRSDPKDSYRTYTVLVVFLLFFLAAMPAETVSAAGERISLDEAVRMALKNNHELQAQRNAHAAKGADIGVARSALLPRIFLEERYLRTASPAYAFMTKLNQERIEFADFAPDTLNHPAAINDFQTAVTLEQPLFVQKARIGLEMSKTEAAASGEALHRKKEEVAFKTAQYYLMVNTTEAYVKVAEKSLEDAQEHQRLAEVRYAAELGLYSDTLRAATAVAEARQRLVSAGKNLSVAKRALGLMIGSAEAVEVAAETPALPIREIESLRTRSLARRDVKSLELR